MLISVSSHKEDLKALGSRKNLIVNVMLLLPINKEVEVPVSCVKIFTLGGFHESSIDYPSSYSSVDYFIFLPDKET